MIEDALDDGRIQDGGDDLQLAAAVWAVLEVVHVGLVTPPYGLLLFMVTKIAEVPLRDIVHKVMPFLYVMIGALALITLFPELVLFLPRSMGYKG